MASPASLASLPRETQLHITDYLDDCCDRLSLVRCSRRFYDLFLPVLYERIGLDDASLATIGPLVQTLARKPFLGAHTRLLGLNSWDADTRRNTQHYDDGFDSHEYSAVISKPHDCLVRAMEAWASWSSSSSSEEEEEHGAESDASRNAYDYALFREKVRLACAGSKAQEEDYWMADLKAYNVDAWVALLLLLVPGLRRLELQFPHGSMYVSWLLERAAAASSSNDNEPGGYPLPICQSLAEVAVDWHSFEGGLHLASVLPFFGLPSVQRFCGKMVTAGPTNIDNDIISGQAQTCPITAIVLEATGISPAGVNALVSRCRYLQSFKYSNTHRCRPIDPDFDPPVLYDCLYATARHTLETLYINSDMESQYWNTPLPSFRAFTALKALHLEITNLPDFVPKSASESAGMTVAEALPPSLERLQVTGIPTFERLRLLVGALETHVRHDLAALVEIVLQGSLLGAAGPDPPLAPEVPGIVAGLERACEEKGVELGMHDYRWDDRIWTGGWRWSHVLPE